MSQLNIEMNLDNLRITLKEVLSAAAFVVTVSFFFSAQNSKLETLTESIKDLKQENKEGANDKKMFDQSITNQVNTNTIQIKIIEQDLKSLKENLSKK